MSVWLFAESVTAQTPKPIYMKLAMYVYLGQTSGRFDLLSLLYSSNPKPMCKIANKIYYSSGIICENKTEQITVSCDLCTRATSEY